MLATIAVIVIVGFMNAPKDEAPKTSRLPSPTKPLFKPEPQLLLADAKLSLSDIQRSHVQKIDAAWRKDRGELEQAIRRFQPRQGRVDQISSGLDDYSDLSRKYDSERARYWSAALAILTPAQQKKVQP